MDLRLYKRAGFIKSPYLQGGDNDWINVSWETNVAGFGSVRWGLAPDKLDHRVVAPELAGAHHEVTLTDLPPDTTIYYRAETDPVKGATARVDAMVRSFRSQPVKGETYRFIAYGDVRTNPDIHAALTVVGDGPVGPIGQQLDAHFGLPEGHHVRDWAVGMKFVVDLPADTEPASPIT
jgi:hypothetical protein